MSVLWDPTVMNTLVVRTRMAPTPAPVSTRTVETAKTAQVIRYRKVLLKTVKNHKSIYKCVMCVCVFVFPPEPVKCENPGSPEFGHREGSNFLMGGEVVFGCENGYELIGSPRLNCLETGSWDDQVPYCRGEGAEWSCHVNTVQQLYYTVY